MVFKNLSAVYQHLKGLLAAIGGFDLQQVNALGVIIDHKGMGRTRPIAHQFLLQYFARQAGKAEDLIGSNIIAQGNTYIIFSGIGEYPDSAGR